MIYFVIYFYSFALKFYFIEIFYFRLGEFTLEKSLRILTLIFEKYLFLHALQFIRFINSFDSSIISKNINSFNSLIFAFNLFNLFNLFNSFNSFHPFILYFTLLSSVLSVSFLTALIWCKCCRSFKE